MAVSTDLNLINEFLERGVENIYPSKEELKKKLLSGQRIRVYQGFDPTGPYLHIGHAMGIRAMRILQKLGHEVIFLIGDFTAKIGDPDKDVTRKILSEEEIEKNMAGWKEQAAQLIDFGGENPVQFKRNFEWLSKLKLEDLLRLMSQSTVQQMLERDMFQRRIKENNPVGLHEFVYPLMQGYDGVAMEVDMEMGGADQTFNMLMGRQLSKAYLGKEKFVRTNQMMEAPDDLTMSKTKGNGINLADSAETMYGKAMSYSDNLIVRALTLLTEVSLEKIEEVKQAIAKGENPMQFKKLLAFEIVKVIKGEAAAVSAQEYFQKTVQNREIPEDIPTVSLKKFEQSEINLVQFLVNQNMAVSNSDARRLIEGGGVEINGEKITDKNYIFTVKSETIIKAGKRKYLKIID